MKRKRRQFSAEWKAKVALEAIKGQRTIQEIASHYEVHPNLVTHWKSSCSMAEAGEQVRAELYQQIGKLQAEVDWLKKSRGFQFSGATGMDRRTSRRPQYRQAMRADRDLQGRAALSARDYLGKYFP
jgi:transposase-like protein